MYQNYRKSEYLEPQAVSLVERSIILYCPYLRGPTIGGFTVLFSCVYFYYMHGSAHPSQWWSVSTTTQPSFTTAQAILTTTHNRVNATPQNAL